MEERTICIKPVYTVEDLAVSMNVSTRQIHKLCSSAILPAVKIGKRYFISHEALMEWMADHTGMFISTK